MLSLLLSCAIAALSMSSTTAYSLCDATNYPYSGAAAGSLEYPLVMALDDKTSPVKATGKIQIVDGCTFAVKDFVYNGGPSVWFGGNGTDTNGIRLSDTVVQPSANPSSATYPFRTAAGSAVSYNDFSQFRLFDEKSLTLVATANIGAAKTTNSTTNPAAKATEKASSGVGMNAGVLGLFAAAIGFF